MDIFETKEPLMINIPDGGKDRPIDYLFKTPTGICFFDIGWPNSSSNAIHFVDGEIKGDGPWQIGDGEIAIVTDEKQLAYYKEWLIAKEKNGITDEQALKLFNGALKLRQEW